MCVLPFASVSVANSLSGLIHLRNSMFLAVRLCVSTQMTRSGSGEGNSCLSSFVVSGRNTDGRSRGYESLRATHSDVYPVGGQIQHNTRCGGDATARAAAGSEAVLACSGFLGGRLFGKLGRNNRSIVRRFGGLRG